MREGMRRGDEEHHMEEHKEHVVHVEH